MDPQSLASCILGTAQAAHAAALESPTDPYRREDWNATGAAEASCEHNAAPLVFLILTVLELWGTSKQPIHDTFTASANISQAKAIAQRPLALHLF